jgi:hypothetical protein
MGTLWFTDIPDESPSLPDIYKKDVSWQIAIAEREGRIGMTVQSSNTEVATVIDVTEYLDTLVDALDSARTRIGRKPRT